MQPRGCHHGPPKIFRGECHVRAGIFAIRYKPVASPHDRLQKSGLRRIVLKGDAYFADRGVDSLLYVDENVFSPQRIRNLFARDELALVFDQIHQQLQRKTLQPYRLSFPAELEASKVELEFFEADLLFWHGKCRQRFL